MPEEAELAAGEAVRVGIVSKVASKIVYSIGSKKHTLETPLASHNEAFLKIISLLDGRESGEPPVRYDCLAHRYVHPGNSFSRASVINGSVVERLKKNIDLAPIHNKVSMGLIEFCSKQFPELTQYAVFDTAFHKTIPDEFAAYALPEKLVKKYGFRKTGFHGISHRYITEESAKYLSRNTAELKLISCHLGSGGSSICAVDGGVSVNNSMGYTPLEGLMMNTRSGDMDIGMLLSIIEKNNLTPVQTENLLNYKSGVLGVFAESSDIRDAAKNLGNRQAKAAFDLYVNRARKYIAYYCLQLHKPDVLVFTDTLGVEMPLIREKICEQMECFGITLDTGKNAAYAGGEANLSAASSQAKVLVIPTNEEVMIARETYREISQ